MDQSVLNHIRRAAKNLSEIPAHMRPAAVEMAVGMAASADAAKKKAECERQLALPATTPQPQDAVAEEI